MLAELGAAIIDADVLAREVVEPGQPAFEQILARFGRGILDGDGRLDRKRLGAIVFGDAAARKDLNAIVHPEVAKLAMQRMQEADAAGAPLIVYDVPLLFENGLDRVLPKVVVVNASPAVQRERIKTRDGLSDLEIEQRIAAQMPMAEKVSRADRIIENDGDLENTKAQVEALFRELTGEIST
jgi:dephospho-CoA kinase